MVRLEWRTKRTDMERWMHHRQIPQPLKQSVDEKALLQNLPVDILRDVAPPLHGPRPASVDGKASIIRSPGKRTSRWKKRTDQRNV
jgi:hypothetical protein